MKRIVIIMTSIMLLLNLSACVSETQDNIPIHISDYVLDDFSYNEANDKPYTYNCIDASVSLQYDNGNIYFWGGLPGEKNTTVMKLNPSTGLCTPICSLSLCEHNTPECPTYGLNAWFYAYNDNIYYKRAYSYTYRNTDGSIRSTVDLSDSVCYDTVHSKLQVLETYNSKNFTEYLNQLFTDNYRFYYDYVFDKDIDKYIFRLCRMDTSNGEVLVIGGDSNADVVIERFVFIKDERIYFVDGKRLYSRTLDNMDEIVHCIGQFGDKVLTDGVGIYFDLYDNDGMRDVYYMSDINDYDSAKKIIDGCTSWCLTENYIYYLDGNKRTIGKSNLTGYHGDVKLMGENIIRCKHNGENKEVVFSFTQDYNKYQINNMVVVDNYIYGLYQYWDDSDNDGVFQDGDQYYSNRSDDFTIMRIDVTDGSVYFIKEGY